MGADRGRIAFGIYAGTNPIGDEAALRGGCSSRRTKPIAKAKEDREPLINGANLILAKFTEYAADPPLIDRSQMIDQREGLLDDSALTGRKGRIQEPLTRRSGYRHDADERKALVADHIRVAHHDTGPDTTLFLAQCGVEFHQDN